MCLHVRSLCSTEPLCLCARRPPHAHAQPGALYSSMPAVKHALRARRERPAHLHAYKGLPVTMLNFSAPAHPCMNACVHGTAIAARSPPSLQVTPQAHIGSSSYCINLTYSTRSL